MSTQRHAADREMNSQIVVGLDIGTTKVCAMVAETDDHGKVNVLGIGIAESDGLHRGVVVNIDKTVASVQKAIGEAMRTADVEVEDVIVGIAGDHILSLQSRGVITIPRDKVISSRDVHRLIDDTTRVAMPADREILHVIPQEFVVDGQDGVDDPVGMSGVRMEASVHIITGLVSAARNIYRCIETAGYHVSDIVLEPLASSFSVLHNDEKELGVVLIDIGGGTTDVAVFEDRTIRHSAVIAVAGNNVTDDIRRGLHLLRDQAEQLKCRFGAALVDLVGPEEEILIPGFGGRPEKSISRSALAQVIQPRMEEILEIVAMEIKRSGYSRHLSAGAVLTGGGSQIPGTQELASEILGLDTRVGWPASRGGGLWEEVSDPRFSTAAGLVLYGLRPQMLGQVTKQEPAGLDRSHGADGSAWGRIVSRMKGWFDEL